MSKNFKSYTIAWSVSLIVFSIISFISAIAYGTRDICSFSYWISYLFMIIAFVGNIACAYFTLGKNDTRKTFYNLPIVIISGINIALTLIASTVFMVLTIRVWTGAIICLAILGINAVSVIGSKLVADKVSDQDDKIKVDTFFIKSLTAQAQNLMATASDERVKAECKKVYEVVRYSDPMSNKALSQIEDSISYQFNNFANAVRTNNIQAASALAKEITALINERNSRCRLLK